MIDLKVKNGVPNAIKVFEHTYLLDTDFRVWIDYPAKRKRLFDGDLEGYRTLFSDPNNLAPPIEETVRQLDMFYENKNVVPRATKERSERVFDFEIDAPFIYASFLQAYGIDLTEVDLHWHKFGALLDSLPGDTVFSTIVGYRMYDGKEQEFKELKYKWELPEEITEEERESVETFEKFFG